MTWIDFSKVNQSCEKSSRCGSGGFAPFGFNGIIQGSKNFI